jgi:hypothetical protein
LSRPHLGGISMMMLAAAMGPFSGGSSRRLTAPGTEPGASVCSPERGCTYVHPCRWDTAAVGQGARRPGVAERV